MQSCSCQHHHEQIQSSDTQSLHLIHLLQRKFLSPYKIIYLIDAKQADHFKLRNQSVGCCSSSSITIPVDQLTALEKKVAEAVGFYRLQAQLDRLLADCADKFEKVVSEGLKNNMQVDDQVEKFLIDKILSEVTNSFIVRIVAEEMSREAASHNQSIGLWATPATWRQQYPHFPLNSLPAQLLQDLTNPSFCAGSADIFCGQAQSIFKELSFLEKDGRFEEVLWQQNNVAIRNDKKIMKDLEHFATFTGENSALRILLLTLSSIPFELNAKLNSYCTVGSSPTVSYYSEHPYHKMHRETCRFIVLVCFGGGLTVQLSSATVQKTLSIKQGQALLIDSSLVEFQIQGEQRGVFIVRSWVHTLKKHST